MSFSILTYYTKNTPYEEEAKRLKEDCKHFNIPINILKPKSCGSWVENTMIKPKMILTMMKKLKEDCLIWLDADARIRIYPHFFRKLDQEGYDFSVFQMGKKSRITSGTIFLRNNKKVQSFVKRWKDICETTKDRRGDQHCLRELIKRESYKKYNIKYISLPYSYCYIFDDSLRTLAPSIKPLDEDPVIVHTQASRKYRKLMK